MRTKQQYIEDLKKKRRNLYYNGEKIARDDEIQMPTIHTMGLTFDYAADPRHEGLCTAISHLTG
ncbi:MAG: aromatic ring hydroxylase, partial [Deltaproteobacteria bacterium]|nr:aromatic ring hydroxylase [Deltaproteobacteria bacterium]